MTNFYVYSTITFPSKKTISVKKLFSCFIISLYLPIVDSPGQSITEPVNPDSVFQLAGHLMDIRNYEDAVDALTGLEYQKAWMEDLNNARKTFNNLGYSYLLLQKYPESAFYYEKAVNLAQQLQDIFKWITSQASLAMAYRQMGHYARSMEANQAALRLSELNNNKESTVSILNTIGILHQNLEQWGKALEKHRAALVISISISDTLMSAYLYTNMAISHAEMDYPDSRLYYNLRSLELKRLLGLPSSDQVSNLNNIGEDYLALGNLEIAEAYLTQASKLYSEKGDNRGLIISHNNLGSLALEKLDFRTAARHLEKAQELFDETYSKDLYLDYLELKTSLLEKQGNYSGALTAHKELAVLREEVFQAERLGVQQVEYTYLLREKELERVTAAQEADFAKAENQRYLQFIGVLALSITVTGLLLYFLFRFNKALRVKNGIIQSQQEDLRHRTFNVLMRVQSLIRMASENLTDENTKRVLANSEAAIISAASLQQYLTVEGKKGYIMMGVYLQDLVGRLEEMFHLTGHRISFKVNIREEVSLPVNTVLNLGIIVAELVTNASKHAFDGQISHPEITVSLEKQEKNLFISVRDNGIGLPQVEKQGIGTGLVRRLAGYIKAELSVQSEGGTFYILKLHT